jgi:dipeptidyl aminopeptidase/acylaminoacyl peptidase
MQDRAGFDPFVQYLAGRMGVAVLSPNVRGSSGYGMDYLRADDGYRRMDAVRDIGAALDYIALRPDLDPERVAVAGRSYGGFMALASLIEFGDRLRAGVSTVGITHFPSFLKETSGYRRDLRRAEYGDERDPRMAAFLDSISPMTRMDRIRRPLLLAHGRNDPRVPYAESVRIFEALKAKRVPAWLLTLEREGHAFRSEESRLLHYGTLAGFLARHLEPEHIGK